MHIRGFGRRDSGKEEKGEERRVGRCGGGRGGRARKEKKKVNCMRNGVLIVSATTAVELDSIS